MIKTILNKNKKKILKLIHHLRPKKLFNKLKHSRKRNQVRLKKIGKMPILILQLISSKEIMAYHRLRKLMKRTMKIFLDNKLKTRKTSVIKSKRKKLMEVNKKLMVIRKQVRTEVTSLLLKPQIKKRQRELRKERRNCQQDKRRERQNYLRRRESFK